MAEGATGPGAAALRAVENCEEEIERIKGTFAVGVPEVRRSRSGRRGLMAGLRGCQHLGEALLPVRSRRDLEMSEKLYIFVLI